MNKFIVFIVVISLLSCKENKNIKSKPIVIGDSSSIVTESDSKKLENYTEDISLVGKKNCADKAITDMMMKVDSAEAKKNIADVNTTAISGYMLKDKNVEIIFDKLDVVKYPTNSSGASVSLVANTNTNLESKLIKVNGLTDVSIQQRYTTMLFAENNTMLFALQDLGKNIIPWSTLATSNNVSESLGKNALQFHTVNKQKITNAVERELRKKNSSSATLTEWKALLSNTNTYSDKPCKVVILASEYKIDGLLNGKKYQKLIRIDVPR